MTHAYPLHVDLIADCLCCHSPQPFRFTSPSDQVVCTWCVRHLGSAKAELRERQHTELWAGLFRDAEETRLRVEAATRDDRATSSATIAGLTDQVAGLTDQVAGLTAIVAGVFDSTDAHAAAGGIRALLENEVITRAERNTTLANRRIDRLMVPIWRIDARHHADQGRAGLCSCGASIVTCPERLAIEPVRSLLRDWETRNLRLQGEGKQHALPDDHPGVSE